MWLPQPTGTAAGGFRGLTREAGLSYCDRKPCYTRTHGRCITLASGNGSDRAFKHRQLSSAWSFSFEIGPKSGRIATLESANGKSQLNTQPAKRMKAVLEEVCHLGLQSVVLFGAGQHTRKVITALMDSPAKIVGFVDESTDRQDTTVCGWPVVGLSELRQLGAQAMVLNSDYHEPVIWARRSQFEALGLRVFRLYPEMDDLDTAAANPQSISEVEASMHGQRRLHVDALHLYWASRGSREADQSNDTSSYTEAVSHSMYLRDWIASCRLDSTAKILELGCNVGRNLAFLRYSGYQNLAAIEINPLAVRAMRDYYPQTADRVDVRVGPFEKILPELESESYDLVFSMAALEHVHPQSDFIFEHIVRIARKYICTMEHEVTRSPRHFPRTYDEVFCNLGCRQLKSLYFKDAGTEQITLLSLDESFVARLFAIQS